MKYYEVIAPLRIAAGSKLHLTIAQAACRKHAVKAIEGSKNLYAVHTLVGFKIGEQLGCDTALDAGSAREIESTSREFNARDTRERKAADELRKKTLEARQKRGPLLSTAFRRPLVPARPVAPIAPADPAETTETPAPAPVVPSGRGAFGKVAGVVRDLFGRKKD